MTGINKKIESEERFIHLRYGKEGDTWILQFSYCDPSTARKINLEAILTTPCDELLIALEPRATEKQIEMANKNRQTLQVRTIQKALEQAEEDGGSVYTRGSDDCTIVQFEISKTKPLNHGNGLSSLKEPREEQDS